MKYLKQLLIILAISFVGEALKYFLPLPIPASIYGMVLLFILLLTGVVKLDDVQDVGKFLIEIMPVYSCRCGSDGILGCVKTHAGAGGGNYRGFPRFRHGNQRTDYPAGHPS